MSDRRATAVPAGRWIWVSLPRATFAVVVADGKVVDAAPYGRKLVPPGMDERAAAEKLCRLGARMVPLIESRDQGRTAMMPNDQLRG